MRAGLRQRISGRLVGENPAVADELKRYYRVYGRPESTLGRGRLAIALWVRYGLLKQDPVKRRDRVRERLVFPESAAHRSVDGEIQEEAIASADSFVFDAWGGLLWPLLDEELSLALAETRGTPDITEAMRIAADLTLDNPRIHRLYDMATQTGKPVCVRNNSDWMSDEATEEAMQRHGYVTVVGAQFPENALRISADAADGSRSAGALGAPYRAWTQVSVVSALYDGIVNRRLHGA